MIPVRVLISSTWLIIDQNAIEWVSDSKRNLVLHHADTSIFLKYYRPRQHTDMQEAVFGLKPDEVIRRALTSISRYADKRRPRYLDDTQKALVEDDPELQTAISKRDAQHTGRIQSEDDAVEESESEDDTPPEQTMLVEGLMAVPVEWTLEGEWMRRNVGTEVIIMYCDFDEGGPL